MPFSPRFTAIRPSLGNTLVLGTLEELWATHIAIFRPWHRRRSVR